MKLKVLLCQLNPTMGDFQENADKIASLIKKAEHSGCDLVVFPELSLSGYPPEDLLHRKYFIQKNIECLNSVVKATNRITAIIGFIDHDKDYAHLYNALAVCAQKKVVYKYHKRCLPNYGVFDEKRYFTPGSNSGIHTLPNGIRLSLTICEDLWIPESPAIEAARRDRADYIVNISASPYHFMKHHSRTQIFQSVSKKTRLPIVYCNQVGGQDELVFDGRSFVTNEKGKVAFQADAFEETAYKLTLPLHKVMPHAELQDAEDIYRAIKLGLRDYIRKNRFSKVIVAMSGGIDSAVVTALAVQTLGKENVLGLTMPSRYTSAATLKDAQDQAKTLGIKCHTIPIEPIFESYLQLLQPYFKNTSSGLAEENIQARIRGNLAMALSNKFGYLVLTTGNKSEMATGYCTLYGDMAGGFAVLKDVPKTWVYKIAHWINAQEKTPIIPKSVIKRAPTAELRYNQKDQDSLPPYAVLDKILENYIEKEKSGYEITKAGIPKHLVQQVMHLVDSNEYKRRQSPIGIKITPKAFGRDRRMPITNRFRS